MHTHREERTRYEGPQRARLSSTLAKEQRYDISTLSRENDEQRHWGDAEQVRVPAQVDRIPLYDGKGALDDDGVEGGDDAADDAEPDADGGDLGAVEED